MSGAFDGNGWTPEQTQTDEDTETGKPTPELAWAVPSDGSGLRTLYTADLHRLMAALSALRRGLS